MSFSIKFYLYLLIITAFAFILAIWAWSEHNPIIAASHGYKVVLFGFLTILYVRRLLKQSDIDEADKLIIITPRRRLAIVLLRAFFGLLIIFAGISLVRRLVSGAPLYLVFSSLLSITANTLPLLFTSHLIDWVWFEENRRKKKKGNRYVTIHKASEPYKFKIKDHNLSYLRETLSCLTCRFNDDDAFEKGEPWCKASNPPEIDNNYCHAFEAK
jgi:hypothetical protein